ncbi:MAG: Carboxypeptidase regulatory-like domain, partial [Candidatus Eremiobacteraeota bacterium]|nr:Carboxypeptidase regulatory-like domain [Candidatus Eremiobacteraeota bacterium]
MSALLRRFFFVVLTLAMSGAFGSSAALAGTTGSIAGAVTDAKTQRPVAAVRVEASSPSQTVSTVTDASGRFTFISLAPDTYAITLSKSAYERLVVGGITVQADQQLSEQLALQPSLQQIGHVTARSPLDLVKPGTTADVYSVGPAITAAAAPLASSGRPAQTPPAP